MYYYVNRILALCTENQPQFSHRAVDNKWCQSVHPAHSYYLLILTFRAALPPPPTPADPPRSSPVPWSSNRIVPGYGMLASNSPLFPPSSLALPPLCTARRHIPSPHLPLPATANAVQTPLLF